MVYDAIPEIPIPGKPARPRLWPGLLVLVLLFAAERTVAQSGDLDILSATISPNVMILLDNSGSMNHHLWDDDFNPEIPYPGFTCTWGNWWDRRWSTAPTIPGSSCPGSGNPEVA